MLTFEQIVVLVALGIVGIISTILLMLGHNKKKAVLSITITIIVIVCLIFRARWYNTSTAQGIRNFQAFQSKIQNDISRTVNIYESDGNLRYHYDGVTDVNDSEAYTLFFATQGGQQIIIHYGVQDLVVIEEVKMEAR